MQDRPGTTPSIRRLQRSMTILSTIKVPILISHQTIKRVARRVRIFASFLIPQAPPDLPVAKVKRLFQRHAVRHRRRNVSLLAVDPCMMYDIVFAVDLNLILHVVESTSWPPYVCHDFTLGNVTTKVVPLSFDWQTTSPP